MAAGGAAGLEQPSLESFTPKNHNRLRFAGIKEHRASIKDSAARTPGMGAKGQTGKAFVEHHGFGSCAHGCT
jgi:hypothetical protein